MRELLCNKYVLILLGVYFVISIYRETQVEGDQVIKSRTIFSFVDLAIGCAIAVFLLRYSLKMFD